MCQSGGGAAILKKYAEIWGVSTDHFDPHHHQRGVPPRGARPLNDVLVENSTYDRGRLKRRLLRAGLIENRCALCGQGEDWCGRTISLILDHINGVGNDHRIENLRIVCPNCAATLDTHCGRANRVERTRTCGVCGRQFLARTAAQQYCSQRCGRRHDRGLPKPDTRKVDRPPYGRLKREIAAMGWSAVGRRYGVSDNAVRKWVRWYENEMARADVSSDEAAPPAPAA